MYNYNFHFCLLSRRKCESQMSFPTQFEFRNITSYIALLSLLTRITVSSSSKSKCGAQLPRLASMSLLMLAAALLRAGSTSTTALVVLLSLRIRS